MLRYDGQLRNGSVATYFFFSVELRRAVLQAATLLFRNSLVEKKNQLVEMRNKQERS